MTQRKYRDSAIAKRQPFCFGLYNIAIRVPKYMYRHSPFLCLSYFSSYCVILSRYTTISMIIGARCLTMTNAYLLPCSVQHVLQCVHSTARYPTTSAAARSFTWSLVAWQLVIIDPGLNLLRSYTQTSFDDNDNFSSSFRHINEAKNFKSWSSSS